MRSTPVPARGSSDTTARQAGSGVFAMKSAYVSCSVVATVTRATARRRVASTVVRRLANDSCTTARARRWSGLSRAGWRGSNGCGSLWARPRRRSREGAPEVLTSDKSAHRRRT